MTNVSTAHIENNNNEQRIDNLDNVFLIYTESDCKLEQPVSDIVNSGTLFHPETGEDMEIDHVVIVDDNNNQTVHDASKIFLVYAETDYVVDQPASDVTYAGTLIHEETGDDLDISYVIITQ